MAAAWFFKGFKLLFTVIFITDLKGLLVGTESLRGLLLVTVIHTLVGVGGPFFTGVSFFPWSFCISEIATTT